MIVAILKGIAIAVVVAVCFALISLILLFVLAMIATANFRRNYGDMYEWYDEEEKDDSDEY